MAAERQELAKAAEKLVGRGRIRAAIEQYRKILEEAPDDTGTLNRVGDLYVRIGRLDKAISLFQKTARHFVRQGFLVKAIAILKKIIRLDPTLMDVYENLADLYERQGLVNDARGQYQVVADYYSKHGNLQRSAAIHQKLVDLEPDDPTHRLRLAELLEELGEASGAMEQYRGIAKLMLAQGEVADATRVAQKALELDPQDLGFLAALIRDFHDSDHSEEVKTLVERATAMNPAAEGIEDLAQIPDVPAEGLPHPTSESDGAVENDVEEIDSTGGGLGRHTDGPGQGKVEIWTSVGSGRDSPVVDLKDLTDFSFGADTSEIVEEDAAASDEEVVADPEFEFDLADLSGGLEADAEPEPPLPPVAPREPERAVASPPSRPEADDRVHPRSGRTVDELFSESEVLQRYGLEDKAAVLLEELLEMDSRHLGALTRLVKLRVSLDQKEEAGRTAARLKTVALQLGVPSVWEEVEEQLDRGGVSIDGHLPVEPAAEVALPTPPVAEPSETELPSPEPVSEQPREVEVPELIAAEVDLLEDDGDFFDLASELEAELDQVTDDRDLLIPIQEEQSLEEIVAGFRRGMQETLSAEDYETHFNLGIAYREMELIDEAIGEFQLAAKEPRHLIQCCSLLASCFVAKGLPELAVKWFEKGLDSPELVEHERLGLLYELGDLHLEHGDVGSARDCFVEIYGVSSSFRDIVARIKELDSSRS